MRGLVFLLISLCVVATLARPNLKKRAHTLQDIVKDELIRQKRQISRGNLVKDGTDSAAQNNFLPTSEAVVSPPETEIKPTSDPSASSATDVPFHLPQDFNGEPLHAVEKSPSKVSPFGRMPGPMGGMPGPMGGMPGPMGGMSRPMGGMRGPMGGMRGPMGGMNGPMGGMRGPMGGMPGPMGGMRGPMGGMPGPMGGMPGQMQGPMGGMPGPMGGMPGPMGGMPGQMQGPMGGMPGPMGGMPGQMQGPMGGMPGPMGGMPGQMQGPMGGMPGPMGGMPGQMQGPMGRMQGPMGGMPGPMSGMPGPMGGMPGPMGGMPGPMGGMPGPMGGMPADFQQPSGAWVDQSKMMAPQQPGDMGKIQEAQKKFMEKMMAIKTGTNGTANMTDEEKKQFLMSDGMPPMTPLQSAVGHESHMVQNMIEYEKQLAEAQHKVLKEFYTDVLTSRVVNTMFRKRLAEELQTLKALNKEVEKTRQSMAGMPEQQLGVVPQSMMGGGPQGIVMDPRAVMMSQAAMMGQMDPRAAMMGQMDPRAAMMGQMDPRAAMMGHMDPRAAMMGHMSAMDPRASMMGQMDPRAAMMNQGSPMADPRVAMQMQRRQMMMARHREMMAQGNTAPGSAFVGRLRQTMQKKK